MLSVQGNNSFLAKRKTDYLLLKIWIRKKREKKKQKRGKEKWFHFLHRNFVS